jgi:formamidopyrimidine-DNA glycosylase
MPELPEVDAIAWRLREGGQGAPPVVGRQIQQAVIRSHRTVDDAAAFGQAVVGRTIRDVQRRAKLILIALDRGTVAVHLRMTGDLLHVPSVLEDARVVLILDDGSALALTDPRHLAHMEVIDDVDARTARYGPEPLDAAFTPSVLRARLALKKKSAIKAALLDQAVLAGIGNIYADESLWEAKLAPTRAVSSLDDDDVEARWRALRVVLTRAVAGRREVIDWMHEGGAGAEFVVYKKAGQPCPRCGTLFERTVVAGRGTWHCPTCQPL